MSLIRSTGATCFSFLGVNAGEGSFFYLSCPALYPRLGAESLHCLVDLEALRVGFTVVLLAGKKLVELEKAVSGLVGVHEALVLSSGVYTVEAALGKRAGLGGLELSSGHSNLVFEILHAGERAGRGVDLSLPVGVGDAHGCEEWRPNQTS